MSNFAALARELSAALGFQCEATPDEELGTAHGAIRYRWLTTQGALFVKVTAGTQSAAVEAEAAGLIELSVTRGLRVPQVRAVGSAVHLAFLALEWIEAQPVDATSEAQLGEGLAGLHALSAARFGWQRNNTIGRTPQDNSPSDDWAEFWRERRLRPQLARAAQHGFTALTDSGERLLEAVPALLQGHRPAPSLLHGDLWGGNWMASARGPVIFDPAVYYGDRETDLAMTHLFGGFGRAFYRAYEACAPLPAGAALRADLYNLYHVLNHANLFGGGYASQAGALIDRLLAQVRP